MHLSNPIKLIVPTGVLRQKRKFRFYHTSSNQELSDLSKFLEVEALKTFSFKGHFIESNENDYLLEASFKATVIQLCVVTLRPVKTNIDHKFNRLFSIVKQRTRAKRLSITHDAIDQEQILNDVNIGDIMLEALTLEIPLYPKIKGVNFEGLTVTDAGSKPLEPVLNNPFSSLKKMK